MARFSPTEIQDKLRGVNFPCTKQELLNQARRNGANEEMQKVLNQLPERQYKGAQEVTQEVSRIA